MIEQCENYSKGSYRNRCHIIGANGVMPLSIPLLKGKNSQMPIREVQISYTNNWQKQHWQSIRSAYGNAPFFEFYADELQPLFEEKTELLFDFNLNLVKTIARLVGLDDHLIFTSSYEASGDFQDFRKGISPKEKHQVPDSGFQAKPYGQVFLEKHDFIPNMSILDLLFCTGPEAVYFLED